MNAKKEIILISPYLKFSKSFIDRLIHKSKKGIKLKLIYGKGDLDKKTWEILEKLDASVYYKENLHAKCYMNEEMAVIGSMNFYEYSEINNEEIGLVISKNEDGSAFEACQSHIEMLVATADFERQSKVSLAVEIKQHKVFDHELFKVEWEKWLKSHFYRFQFTYNNGVLTGTHSDKRSIGISLDYGILTIILPVSVEQGKQIREEKYLSLVSKMKGYRVFWNNPYTRIMIYSSKEVLSTELELEMCKQGIMTFFSALKELNIVSPQS